MTSDAKIGLLLGLVFIFVIAFVINGLPTLRPQSTKAQVATDSMQARDENLGVAGRAQKAQETIGWAELLDAQSGGPVESAAVATSPETQVPDSAPVVAVDNPGEAVPPALLSPSSDGMEKLTKGLEDIVKNLAEGSGPAAGQENTTEPAPAVEVAKSDPLSSAAKPQRLQSAETAKPAGVGTKTGRTYIVQDGENLASVAKKVYGPEEGNRIINVQRIYEANRDILKSPDEVRSGQELVIPPADKAKAAEKKPDSVLPKALFEKVQEIGKGRVTADKKTPENPAAGRWYVVQQDDSLWKIATSQLGKGARYQEILKLNSDVLKDADSIAVGMRLQLPAK
jgi:nucleoid-associated protein YgaU